MTISRTNIGRQMVGDLGGFVGQDVSKQFMKKPRKLYAEGETVEVESEETITKTFPNGKTWTWNPSIESEPDPETGRTRKFKRGTGKMIGSEAGMTEQLTGLGGVNLFGQATEGKAEAVETGKAPPTVADKEKINPETDADEAARQEDRDQIFNPITGIGKQIPVEDIHQRNQVYQTVGPYLEGRYGIEFQPRGPLEQWLTTGDSKYVGNYSGVPATRSDGSIDLSQPYPSRIMDNRREGLGLTDWMAKSELDYALGKTGYKDATLVTDEDADVGGTNVPRTEISPKDLTEKDIRNLEQASEMSLADLESGQSADEQIRAADVSKRGDTPSPQEIADIERQRKDLGLLPNTRTWTKTPSNFDIMNPKTWRVPRAYDTRSGKWNIPLDQYEKRKAVKKDEKDEEKAEDAQGKLKDTLQKIMGDIDKKYKGVTKASGVFDPFGGGIRDSWVTGGGAERESPDPTVRVRREVGDAASGDDRAWNYVKDYWGAVDQAQNKGLASDAEPGFSSAMDIINQAQEEYADADWIMNTGGPIPFAQGGGLSSLADKNLAPGSFVLSADTISGIGDGSSESGLRRLNTELGFPITPNGVEGRAYGGTISGTVRGPGSGLDDLNQTTIAGKQAAALANQEVVVSPGSVTRLAQMLFPDKNMSTQEALKSGQEALYNFQTNVRKQKADSSKGGKQPGPLKTGKGGLRDLMMAG